jgi:hypothetical protein
MAPRLSAASVVRPSLGAGPILEKWLTEFTPQLVFAVVQTFFRLEL